MLFAYPIQATEENELHDALCDTINLIFEYAKTRNTIPGWPELLPAEQRDSLKSKTGLKKRLNTFKDTFLKLDTAQQQQVYTCMMQQNDISGLLDGSAPCLLLNDLPELIRQPCRDLFEFAFTLLTDLGIRDRHYQIIYHALDNKGCPFCGCEFFDAPGAPREDEDHYLAKSLYPFAASNLKNLVPMGAKCNQRYKKAQNIIFDADGNRRTAFDPYHHQGVEISLINSQAFSAENNALPLWQIDFAPDSPECETWNQVFSIRERYRRDVLDPSYKRWLDQFRNWCKRRSIAGHLDVSNLTALIWEFIENLKIMAPSGPDFLQEKVFLMLHRHCKEGNTRLINLLRDAASGIQPALYL